MALARKFCLAKCCKILLAPEQARYGLNCILFERSIRGQIGNEPPVQFLEGGSIFSGKDGGRGIASVFEGGVNFIDST